MHEPALDRFPFLRGNDSRHEIERENAFRSLVVVVDREGDALGQKSGGGEFALALELRALHLLESLEQLAVMRADNAGRDEHFIKEFSDLVAGKKVAHRSSLAVRYFEANGKPAHSRQRRMKKRARAFRRSFGRAGSAITPPGKLRRDRVFRAALRIIARFRRADSGRGMRGWFVAVLSADARGEAAGYRTRPGWAQDPARAFGCGEGRLSGLTFLEQNATRELPEFRGNIALFDALHYLHPGAQTKLLSQLAARVAPGGMLLLRDCPRDRSARFWATYLGEIFAQTISWNVGGPLHFPTRASINEAFGDEVFAREERPMFGGGPFNNRLFIFRAEVRHRSVIARITRAVVPGAE